jgi:hypothetical protein
LERLKPSLREREHRELPAAREQGRDTLREEVGAPAEPVFRNPEGIGVHKPPDVYGAMPTEGFAEDPQFRFCQCFRLRCGDPADSSLLSLLG